MKKVREQLSPALVISVIALFVALGGGAYALSANTVGSKQLKRNAVTTAKIRNGAVNVNKIKSGAVTAAKIASNAVTTSKVKDSAITSAKLAQDALGRAVAFARVNRDGTMNEDKSRGFSDATIDIYGTSIFCLSNLPDFGTFTVTPGMGLTEFDGIASVNVDQAPFDEGICSPYPDAQIAVKTYYDDFFGSLAPVASKMPFTIVLFK